MAAAVVLNPERPIRGLNDSKQLDAERRVVLAERIRERAFTWAVAAVDAAMIDLINIYQASRMAMRLAVEQLQPRPDFLLTDAVPLELPIPQRALIKGDARCHAIAAASILAKVHRDAAMTQWDKVFPEYGLADNKGYSAPQHLEALERYGPTPLHRLSFEPARAASLFPVSTEPWNEDQLNLFSPGVECL
jgi:ribonuclease HII